MLEAQSQLQGQGAWLYGYTGNLPTQLSTVAAEARAIFTIEVS